MAAEGSPRIQASPPPISLLPSPADADALLLRGYCTTGPGEACRRPRPSDLTRHRAGRGHLMQSRSVLLLSLPARNDFPAPAAASSPSRAPEPKTKSQLVLIGRCRNATTERCPSSPPSYMPTRCVNSTGAGAIRLPSQWSEGGASRPLHARLRRTC
jgi:hypothetical protein